MLLWAFNKELMNNNSLYEVSRYFWSPSVCNAVCFQFKTQGLIAFQSKGYYWFGVIHPIARENWGPNRVANSFVIPPRWTLILYTGSLYCLPDFALCYGQWFQMAYTVIFKLQVIYNTTKLPLFCYHYWKSIDKRHFAKEVAYFPICKFLSCRRSRRILYCFSFFFRFLLLLLLLLLLSVNIAISPTAYMVWPCDSGYIH